MATPLREMKRVLWFNKRMCAKRMQRLFGEEFGVNTLSKSCIYAFYKQFCDTICLCKGRVPFAARCMDRTHASKVTLSANMESI
jgi:hypothetical protein